MGVVRTGIKHGISGNQYQYFARYKLRLTGHSAKSNKIDEVTILNPPLTT